MDVQYIVIDSTDPYGKRVSKYPSKEAMLNGVQHLQPDNLEVFKVSSQVRLTLRPAVVEAED